MHLSSQAPFNKRSITDNIHDIPNTQSSVPRAGHQYGATGAKLWGDHPTTVSSAHMRHHCFLEIPNLGEYGTIETNKCV